MFYNLIVLLNTVKPEPFVFGLDKQTLINVSIQLINAVILASALGFILYKPVQEFLHKRTNKINDQLNDAKQKNIKAEALKEEYQNKLSNIDKERLKILEKAKADAHENAKHILEDARIEADKLKKRAEDSILHEKERLKKETKLHIIEVSSLMATKLIQLKIDEDMQNKIYDDALASLEDIQWPS